MRNIRGYKRENGITLIALVITIIVLIILAAVSVLLLVGNNGILDKTKSAIESKNIAERQEFLELEKAPVQLKKHGVDLDSYIEQIDNYNNDKGYEINYIDKLDDINAYVLVDEKYKFLVKDTEDGNVEIIYQGIAGRLTLSSKEGTYTYPVSGTFTVTQNESGGTLSVKSSNENIATASISGDEITVTPKTAGTAIITVTSAATDKYVENRVKYEATVQNGEMEVTAIPYEGEYDGKPHTITVTCDQPDAEIEYSTDGSTYSTTNPTYTDVTKSTDTNVTGAVTIYYKVTKENYKTVSGSQTVTVTKASNTLQLSETSGSTTYGTNKTFTVSKNTSGGALSVTSSNTSLVTASISGSTVTLVPKTNTPGTATITVTSAATENYKAQTATYTLTVKGKIDVIVTGYSGAYDGKAHSITVTPTPADAKIEYSKDGKTYTTTKPTYTDVTKSTDTNATDTNVTEAVTIYYKVTKTNYTTVSGSQTVTITKASNTLQLSATSGSTTYGTNATFTVSKNTSGGTLSVTSSNTSLVTASISGSTVTLVPKTNTPGTATITVTSAATGNYKAQTATYTLTVKGKINVTATEYSGVYDGKAHSITVTCTPADAKIEYSKDGGKTYTTTKPTYTDVTEAVTIYYKVTKTNYTTVSGNKTVTITQANNSISLALNTPNAVTDEVHGQSTVYTISSTLSTLNLQIWHNDSPCGNPVTLSKGSYASVHGLKFTWSADNKLTVTGNNTKTGCLNYLSIKFKLSSGGEGTGYKLANATSYVITTRPIDSQKVASIGEKVLYAANNNGSMQYDVSQENGIVNRFNNNTPASIKVEIKYKCKSGKLTIYNNQVDSLVTNIEKTISLNNNASGWTTQEIDLASMWSMQFTSETKWDAMVVTKIKSITR